MADGRYLNLDLTFNRAALMRAAWAKARFAAAKYGTTLREELSDALRRLWDQAKAYRSIALWRAQVAAQAEAEAARRAVLPAGVVALEDARSALLLAEMSDGVASHEAVAAARAHVASLQLAA